MGSVMFQENGFVKGLKLGRKALCAILSFAVLNASLAPVMAMPESSQGYDPGSEMCPKVLDRIAAEAVFQGDYEEAVPLPSPAPKAASTHIGYASWMLQGLESIADITFAASKGLLSLVSRSVSYALKNPGEALVAGLATQIAVTHAIRPVTDDFLINQNTTQFGAPSVAGLSNGNILVTWKGVRAGTYDIYGRVLAPNGTALTNDFTINQITTGSQESPAVAALSNGNAFVVWQGYQTGNYDIYGRVLAPNGTVLTNDFTINQNRTGTQFTPSVTALSNGNALVTWAGGQTGNADIYGRVLAPNGIVLTNEFTINQVITGTPTDPFPFVTALSNGNALVTWHGDRTGTYDIYGRVLASNGTALTNEFTINQITTGTQWYPSVAALNNGNALVTWQGNQAGAYDVYGRVLAPNGTALTNEFIVNQITAGDQYYSSVAGLSNGNALVTWVGNQTRTYDVYGRVLAPNGTILSGEFAINQNTTGYQQPSSVAALSNGNVLVTWYGYQFPSADIYGRVFDMSDPTTITTGAQVTTGLQTTALQTTGLQTTGLQTTGVQVTTGLQSITGPQPTSPVLVPTLLGMGGAVLGVSLGGALLTACAVGGICVIKHHKKKQSQKQAKNQPPASNNLYGTPPEFLLGGDSFTGKTNPYGTPPEFRPGGKDFQGNSSTIIPSSPGAKPDNAGYGRPIQISKEQNRQPTGEG
ncbi:MAG: hypothetical protein ACRCUQ_04825 [Alphaproteobacteria bacterium]